MRESCVLLVPSPQTASMATTSASAILLPHSFSPSSLCRQRPLKHRHSLCARANAINPSIKKDEAKVVDTVLVSELEKPLQAYCRCWRSGTFPLCDGSHVKHNKETGDNVGPLLLKK